MKSTWEARGVKDDKLIARGEPSKIAKKAKKTGKKFYLAWVPDPNTIYIF